MHFLLAQVGANEPLQLRTIPAAVEAAPGSAARARPHRGQGPDGLGGASPDDDGRVRQRLKRRTMYENDFPPCAAAMFGVGHKGRYV